MFEFWVFTQADVTCKYRQYLCYWYNSLFLFGDSSNISQIITCSYILIFNSYTHSPIFLHFPFPICPVVVKSLYLKKSGWFLYSFLFLR